MELTQNPNSSSEEPLYFQECFVTKLLPTEPIGSMPRPLKFQHIDPWVIPGIPESLFLENPSLIIRETLTQIELTGSPVITDGEQTKPSFIHYPLYGLTNVRYDKGGVVLPFSNHIRMLPFLSEGPFRYAIYASEYTKLAKSLTKLPLKQAVISASAMSLIYPDEGISAYTKQDFMDDVVSEAVKDIKQCFEEGAACVQVDMTEARFSMKLDPSGELLRAMIDLNNIVFSHFDEEELKKIGAHTCPGGDCDSTHSADIDYNELLPTFMQLNCHNFFMQMASEPDPERILEIIKSHLRPHQRIFIGVIDVNNPIIETPELVRDRILVAAKFIPLNQLGTTDDCGYSPFNDDVSTSREIALSKVRSRILGTQMASKILFKPDLQ
jgi:5-methyltetrahydropteroyltriglutamate--homocysteine methyltransferase